MNVKMHWKEDFGVPNVGMITPNDKYIIDIHGENDTTLDSRLLKDCGIHVTCQEAPLSNQCVKLGKSSS